MSELIDRKALCEELNKCIRKHFNLSDEFDYVLKGFEKALDIIADAPTVEAKPVVHGEWIREDEEDEAWECSICGKLWCLYGTPIDNGMNFCPKCGADMRKKVE